MRRPITLVLVAAVAVLGALAVADALRSEPRPSPPAARSAVTSTRPQPATLVESLRREDVSGLILYSDRDCILHSLLLPQMVDEHVKREISRITGRPL